MKFQTIVLGKGLEKQKNGFSGNGDWICLKCFVEDTKRYGDAGYGEFYLNINEKTGEGEIKMKDKNYAVFLEEMFSREMNGLNLEEN